MLTVVLTRENSYDYPRKATNTFTMAVRILNCTNMLDWETIALGLPYGFEHVQNCRGPSWSKRTAQDSSRFTQMLPRMYPWFVPIHLDFLNRGLSWPKSWQCMWPYLTLLSFFFFFLSDLSGFRDGERFNVRIYSSVLYFWKKELNSS